MLFSLLMSSPVMAQEKRYGPSPTLTVEEMLRNALLMSSPVMAQEKRYGASPQQSTWEMVANTPLECRLVEEDRCQYNSSSGWFDSGEGGDVGRFVQG